jgi:glycosyltransferase involved in cell wall biosynthesis
VASPGRRGPLPLRWWSPRRKPLRVAIEARLVDGESGGVQQWIIGLAGALSKLEDGSEEYLFIAKDGHEDWLTPYLGGPCRLMPAPARPAPGTARAAAGAPSGDAPRRSSGPLRRLSPRRILRGLRRRIERRLPAATTTTFLSALDKRISDAGADVMHFPRQVAAETRVPSIYQPWDLQHLHLPEFFTPEVREAREVSYRAFCAQAARIVVASRWIKDDVCAQYGIAADRVAVVNPPPITSAYAAPGSDDVALIEQRLALPARYAFYPAQPWAHKNHERLFQALRVLRDRGVVVPLVCSGHRNARYPEVADRAAALGIADQVTFLGFLTPTEIQVLYGRAAMLVFPSLYEGWGLPILEAFAADLPVACSNVTSLPRLVGDAALVFDPTDVEAMAGAIGRLWSNTQLGRALAARGRARLGDFDWERTARLMRALYRQVAGRPLDTEDRALLAADPPV